MRSIRNKESSQGPDAKSRKDGEQKTNSFSTTQVYYFALNSGWVGKMSEIARDFSAVVRLCEYCRELERLHLWGDDEDIDSEFNAVCRGRTPATISTTTRCRPTTTPSSTT
jgi:hypothetical protein